MLLIPIHYTVVGIINIPTVTVILAAAELLCRATVRLPVRISYCALAQLFDRDKMWRWSLGQYMEGSIG